MTAPYEEALNELIVVLCHIANILEESNRIQKSANDDAQKAMEKSVEQARQTTAIMQANAMNRSEQ